MKRKLFFLSVLIFPFFLNAQIVINEICSRNSAVVKDEEGDYEDWIELYNAGNETINLSGYFLSDEKKESAKWRFPEITMKPQSHLVVLASGKDRIKPLDKGASVAHAEEKWEYFVTTSKIADDWIEMDFSGSGWISTHIDEGMNDGDGFPVFSPPGTKVYMRKKLVIFDMVRVKKATLEINIEFPVRVFVNGLEVKPVSTQKGVFNVYLLLQTGINLVAVEVQNNNEYSEILTPQLTLELSESIPEYVVQEFDSFKFYLQTNFKLSKKGENLFLSDPSSKIIDKVTYPYLQLDNSYGRKEDGSTEWTFFYHPSPEKSNGSETAYNGYVEDIPQFSMGAGYCSRGAKVEISCPGAAVEIRFTADGSVPGFSSPVYKSPVKLDSTVVIRTRCFKKDLIPGEVITRTYLVDEKFTLPVVSLSTSPSNLWDPETGIYAASGVIDLLDNEDVEANFWEDWEIPVHVEFFSESGKNEFSGDYGAKIHGAASRKYPQKSFRIFATDAFGNNNIDYKLFPEKNIDSYKRFLLRNSGNEWNKTHFRDGFVSRSVMNTTFNDVQAYRPSVVFLNGIYWGILNIREQVGRYYIEENYGIKADSIELIEKSHTILGTRLNFDRMIYFIRSTEMTDDANYETVKSMLDIQNYCDYIITELFYDNTDWPSNNVKLWRENVPGGKWRYILFDLDLSMGFHRVEKVQDAHLRILTSKSSHAEIFVGLAKNLSFRNYFINRYADLLNTLFQPSNLKKVITDIKSEIQDEMPRHLQRWGLTLDSWNQEVNKLLAFVEKRPNESWSYVQKSFGLSSQLLLTLNAEPTGAGTIRINTITPQQTPWTGIYFAGVPVELEAISNPGFEFVGWESDQGIEQKPTIQIALTQDSNITANFKSPKQR